MVGGILGLSNKKILAQMERDVETIQERCYDEVAETVRNKELTELPEVLR